MPYGVLGCLYDSGSCNLEVYGPIQHGHHTLPQGLYSPSFLLSKLLDQDWMQGPRMHAMNTLYDVF